MSSLKGWDRSSLPGLAADPYCGRSRPCGRAPSSGLGVKDRPSGPRSGSNPHWADFKGAARRGLWPLPATMPPPRPPPAPPAGKVDVISCHEPCHAATDRRGSSLLGGCARGQPVTKITTTASSSPCSPSATTYPTIRRASEPSADRPATRSSEPCTRRPQRPRTSDLSYPAATHGRG
jgi:hypothetical protein